MPLGTEVDLSPGHIVLDRDPALLPAKGAQQPPPLFGPCLLWLQSPISATAYLVTYKIIFGHTELKTSDYFVLKNQSYIVAQGNRFKIAINHKHINAKIFFNTRVAGVWNSLSDC